MLKFTKIFGRPLGNTCCGLLLVKHVTWTGGIFLMCPHEPEGECGHINQNMTAHVTCVTGPVTINNVSNKLQLHAIIIFFNYL